MREYRSATVLNHGNGMSDATYDTVHGVHRARTGPSEVYVDGENVVSSFVRTSRMKTTLQDEFDTVRGNKNYYVGGDFTIRVDGRFNIIAGNSDAKKSFQKEWMNATAELAAARAAGEVKRGFIPLGQADVKPKLEGNFRKNPLLESRFTSTNSTSNGLETQGDSLTAKRVNDTSGINNWGKVEGDTTQQSPSTQGGDFMQNEVDFEELHQQTQTKLTEIERNMTRNDVPMIGDNFVFATSGPPNSRPPGRKDPIGRLERKGIKIFNKGPATDYIGVPHYEEVDNYSDVPFGNVNFKAGNNFTVEAGNGGINLMTGGSVKLVGGSNTLIGGEQVLIAGKGNVRIHGASHIGLKSDNIDFQSSNPITMSNLAVENNIVTGGGAYINGELFINHITAPKEWQKTNHEPNITYGNPVAGQIIGIDSMGGNVIAVATPNSIKINRHIHWFENLPLSLHESNSDMRQRATALNNNGVVAALPASDR